MPTTWVWQPAWSPQQLTAVALVLGGLGIWAYSRLLRDRLVPAVVLGLWRVLSIVIVCVLLAGPSREVPAKQAGRRSSLTILVDTSGSMQTEDMDGISRLDFLRTQWLDSAHRRQLADVVDIDLNRFDTDLRPLLPALLDQNATFWNPGRTTRLAESLATVVSRQPAGGAGAVLLISDGHDTAQTSLQPVAAQAKSRGVLIHTVPLGGRSQQRDVALLALPLQEQLYPNEPGAILCKLYQVGLNQRHVTLIVKQGETVQRIPVTLDRPIVELKVPVQQSKPGQYEYQVDIEPLVDEATTSNNSQRVFFEVQRKKIRVLMLEGQPYWDSKFLAQSLRKDERIELTQITQIASARRETIVSHAEQSAKPASLPVSLEDWSQYDVVLLGQALEHLLTVDSAAQLTEFVASHGGQVVFVRGPCCTPESPRAAQIARAMAMLEPVEWSGTAQDVSRQGSLRLSPAGKSTPWLASGKMGVDIDAALVRLPGFLSRVKTASEKPAAVVLARQGDTDVAQPALVSMNVGRGNVVAILGDGLWKWSLLRDLDAELLPFYDTFWSNLVRWLALGGDFPPGQQVALQLSRRSLRLGEPLQIDVAYRHTPPGGAPPRLEALLPGGKLQELALAPTAGKTPRYRAVLNTELAGVHEFRLTAPGMQPDTASARCNVVEVNEELLDTSADPDSLRQLAEQTGGRTFAPDEADQFLKQLERHQQASLVPPRREYVWNDWKVMLAVLGWVTVEWLLRRRWGWI